jgi:hypothetical protein
VVLAFDLDRNSEVGLVEDLQDVSEIPLSQLEASMLTLKLLWTRVSSRSSTKHFFPLNWDVIGGKSHFCAGSGVDTALAS